MKKGLKFDKSNYQKLVIVGILLVIMLALTLLSKDFLTPANVTNVFRQVAATVIVGCGVTMLMVAGNFDLSIGSIMAISGVMAALMVSNGFRRRDSDLHRYRRDRRPDQRLSGGSSKRAFDHRHAGIDVCGARRGVGHHRRQFHQPRAGQELYRAGARLSGAGAHQHSDHRRGICAVLFHPAQNAAGQIFLRHRRQPPHGAAERHQRASGGRYAVCTGRCAFRLRRRDDGFPPGRGQRQHGRWL